MQKKHRDSVYGFSSCVAHIQIDGARDQIDRRSMSAALRMIQLPRHPGQFVSHRLNENRGGVLCGYASAVLFQIGSVSVRF